MKTLKSFVWMLAMTAAILTASCSGSGSVEAKLDKYVPDDVDLVFTGDIQRAVEATGSTIEDGAIKPSAMLEDMIGTMSAGDATSCANSCLSKAWTGPTASLPCV